MSFGEFGFIPRESTEISLITFFLKQWILDSLPQWMASNYANPNIDSHFQGLKFIEAADWPGLPNEGAVILSEENAETVKISGNYHKAKGVQTNGEDFAYRLTGHFLKSNL